MAKNYRQNLYQNAIDSLEEGVVYYNKSLEDESKYKFCIVLISNFMELMLKYLVELQHKLLCYEKPFSNRINTEKTITWQQALQILSNSGIFIDKNFDENTKRLSELRNKIIHFAFEYDTSIIRANIFSVIDGLRKLYKNVTHNDFFTDVDETTTKLLETIQDEYLSQLHLAQAEAKEEATDKNFSIVDCCLCGEANTAVEREHDETYCYFCKETDCLVECTRCTVPCKMSEMEYWGKNDYGDDMYFCQYCDSFLRSDD